VYNFFCRGKCADGDVIEPAKTRTTGKRSARSCRNAAKRDLVKTPHFIGISLSRANIRAQQRQRRIFRRGNLPAIAMRMRREAGARHLHTKLSGVTVIFFLL